MPVGALINAMQSRLTRVHQNMMAALPAGLMRCHCCLLNKNADRFYDEGEDFWPKRYAIWGRLVAGQPDQITYYYRFWGVNRFMPSVFTPIVDDTIEGLATRLGRAKAATKNTIDACTACRLVRLINLF